MEDFQGFRNFIYDMSKLESRDAKRTEGSTDRGGWGLTIAIVYAMLLGVLQAIPAHSEATFA